MGPTRVEGVPRGVGAPPYDPAMGGIKSINIAGT